jgi:hypothetical protein
MPQRGTVFERWGGVVAPASADRSSAMADQLFTEGRLEDVLEERLKRAESVVDELPAKSLARKKKAVNKVVAELTIEAPELKRDKAKIDVSEGSPLTAQLHIPYTGDPEMFALRPASYSLAPPDATVRDPEDGGVLEFGREFPDGTSSDDVTAWATQAAETVEQYLYWQAGDIGEHRIRLQERVEELVEDRKSRADSVEELQSELDDVDDV